uniref:Uncharacterized protein n=1 Tax=Micrurus surinamensis TaxID=129470 RepID=A0A2D4P543_MICSU
MRAPPCPLCMRVQFPHPLTCTAHARASQLIFGPFEAFLGLPGARGRPLQPLEAKKWTCFITSGISKNAGSYETGLIFGLRGLGGLPLSLWRAEGGLKRAEDQLGDTCMRTAVQVSLAGARVPVQMALCATCSMRAIGSPS